MEPLKGAQTSAVELYRQTHFFAKKEIALEAFCCSYQMPTSTNFNHLDILRHIEGLLFGACLGSLWAFLPEK